MGEYKSKVLGSLVVGSTNSITFSFISDLDENVFERIDKAMKRYQSSLDTGNVGLDAVYRFVEDIHNHNEVTSLTVPVFGSISHVTFLSPKDHAEREREKARLRRNSTRRPSSNVRAPLLPAAHDSGDGEVFELDIDDDRPSPSITRAALAERRYSSNARSSNVDSANFSSPSSRPVFAVSPTMRRGSSSSLNMSENSPNRILMDGLLYHLIKGTQGHLLRVMLHLNIRQSRLVILVGIHRIRDKKLHLVKFGNHRHYQRLLQRQIPLGQG